MLNIETTPVHHALVADFLELKETVKRCILQEKFIEAQEVKVNINLLQQKMLQHEMDEIMIRLYLKFRKLERKIDTFIIMQLRDEFNALETTTQTMYRTIYFGGIGILNNFSPPIHSNIVELVINIAEPATIFL